MADVAAPVAAFSITPDSPVTAGVPVQFSDQSTGGTPSDWAWNFGDGTPGSSLRNPTHVFTEGTYTVRLEVKNNGGRDDVTARSSSARPRRRPTSPSCQLAPNAGQEVRFTDASTNAGAGTTWSWTFGDGAPARSGARGTRSPSATPTP